jgi:hypothetical protein
MAMDANGARALALRIDEGPGSLPETQPTPKVNAVDAAPIFHWLGIEPPGASSPDPARE